MKGCDGVPIFVDSINPGVGGVLFQVARAGIGFELNVVVMIQVAIFNSIDQDLLQTQVAGQGVWAVGHKANAMGVGSVGFGLGLTGGMCQPAIWFDRVANEIASVIVGADKLRAGWVNIQKTGRIAQGWLLVEQAQVSIIADREGTDGAIGWAAEFSYFVDGVEKLPGGVHGQEGWILTGCAGKRSDFLCLRIELVANDPLARIRARGIGSDVQLPGGGGVHFHRRNQGMG